MQENRPGWLNSNANEALNTIQGKKHLLCSWNKYPDCMANRQASARFRCDGVGALCGGNTSGDGTGQASGQ